MKFLVVLGVVTWMLPSFPPILLILIKTVMSCRDGVVQVEATGFKLKGCDFSKYQVEERMGWDSNYRGWDSNYINIFSMKFAFSSFSSISKIGSIFTTNF